MIIMEATLNSIKGKLFFNYLIMNCFKKLFYFLTRKHSSRMRHPAEAEGAGMGSMYIEVQSIIGNGHMGPLPATSLMGGNKLQ